MPRCRLQAIQALPEAARRLGLRCRGVAYTILGRDVAGHGAGPRGPKVQQRRGKGNTLEPIKCGNRETETSVATLRYQTI